LETTCHTISRPQELCLSVPSSLLQPSSLSPIRNHQHNGGQQKEGQQKEGQQKEGQQKEGRQKGSRQKGSRDRLFQDRIFTCDANAHTF